MSFFIQMDGGRLARDVWGFPEAIIGNDTADRIRLFPDNYEVLCDTLALVPKHPGHPRSMEKEVVLKNQREEGETTIVLRIQGFIQQLKLGRLGDWDGDAKKCKTAVNVLHVEAGSVAYEELWASTWTAIRSLRRWVAAVSHAVCADRRQKSDMDTIRCSRRAFIKATPGVSPMALDDSDPLQLAAVRVQKSWIAERPIGFGVRRPDGRVGRVDPAIFSKGDFVDVAFSFDVVRRNNGKVNVYLRLEHVIQLASYENESAVSIRVLKGVGVEPVPQRLASTTVAFADDDL